MRLRLASALPLAVAVLCAASAPAARADPEQVVVNATIYPGGAGSVSTQSVTLGTLAGCPLYGGSSPMYLYPGDQPYSPAADSSWALSTVITCGLGQPLDQVTQVQLDNPSRGFETPLSNPELSDPGQYQDPAAPDALPVLSVDGTENQNTYVRPWLGGSDNNASDEVIADGAPLTLVVYENAASLRVGASARTVSQTSKSMAVQLSAKVRDTAGTEISASSLSWSWNFADGATATSPSPRHSFVPGVFPVTVQVTDATTGTGGTATIQVRFSPTSGTDSGSRSGAGRSRKSRAPTGTVHGRGNASGTASRPATRSESPGARAPSVISPSSEAVRSTQPSVSSSPRAHRSRARVAHPRRSPSRKPTPPRAPAGPIVSGRLISDVTPVSPATTSFARSFTSAGAPAVRGASQPSTLPTVGSLVLVLALFGLGAARELRGVV